MKNKRVLVKIIFVISLFFFSFDVYADSIVYDTFDLYLQTFATDQYTCVKYNDKNGRTQSFKYGHFKGNIGSKSGTEVDAYCMDPGNKGGRGNEVGRCTRLSSSIMGAAGETVNTDDVKAFEYMFAKGGVDTTTKGLAIRIFGIPRLTQAATSNQNAKTSFIVTGELADGMSLSAKEASLALQDDDGSANPNCKGRSSSHLKDALALIKEATDYASKFDYSGYTDFAKSDSTIEDAIKWATQIANDDTHGYSQVTRNGNPNYDCSSLVIYAYENAGLGVIENGASYTGNMIKAFENAGFTYIAYPSGAPDTTQLKRGDVLLRIGVSGHSNHTELYIGNSQTIGAHADFDKQDGDKKTHREIDIGPYSKTSAWNGVLRYTGGSSVPVRDITFTLRSRKDLISVYDVHSNISIPANNLMFSCNSDKCSQIIVGNWDGNSGVIVVFAKSLEDCDVSLNAYYVKNKTGSECPPVNPDPPDPTCEYDNTCNGPIRIITNPTEPDDNVGDSPTTLKYNPDDPLCYVYFCTTDGSTQNYLTCLTPEQNESVTGIKSCKSGKSSNGSCNTSTSSSSTASNLNLADFNMNIGSGVLSSAAFNFSYPSNANNTCVNPTPEAQMIGAFVAEECKQDCCTLKPIDLKDYPKYEIHNCCGGGTSWIDEPAINDLFCLDEKLQVDYYKEKCNVSTYLVDKSDFNTLNDYCDLYCTERVTYDLPNPTTNATSGCAKSGRYFQFDRSNAWGTSGPRVEGFKRCRLKVKFDDWWNDYDPIVKAEVSQYNLHESNIAAYQEFYSAFKDTESITYSINCSSSGTSEPSYKTGEEDDKSSCKRYNPLKPLQCLEYNKKDVKATCSAPADSSGNGNTTRTYDIKRYTLPFTWNYNVLKLDENSSLYKTFQKDQIIIDKYLSAHETYGLEKVYLDVKDEAEKENLARQVAASQAKTLNDNADYTSHKCESSYETAYGTRSYTCGISYNYDHTAVDYEGKLSEYLGAASGAQSSMRTYAAQAKIMENKLSNCTNFFISGSGSVVDNVYKMDPSVSFTYTQAYLDNRGSYTVTVEESPRGYVRSTILKQVETGYQYNGASSHGTDDRRFAKKINDKDNTGTKFVSIDFKDADLNIIPDPYNNFSSHLDEEFPKGNLAEDAYNKAFTRDAVYHLVYTWDDTSNTIYTLVPTGSVQKSPSLSSFYYNKTTHEYAFSYLTSLSGNYETYFKLSGIGSDGKFDAYVNNGTTCSNKTGNATCYFCIINTITNNGNCNNDWAKILPEDVVCDNSGTPPNDNFKLNFEFKVSDPRNLFPSGRSYNGTQIAKNWSDDDINRVQNVGNQDKTYSPENLTYSFKLTAKDLKNIKEYNASRVSSGGFDDFNLYCDCSGNICTKCISSFINAISGKDTISYQGNNIGYLSIDAWNNPNKSLDQVRNEQSW